MATVTVTVAPTATAVDLGCDRQTDDGSRAHVIAPPLAGPIGARLNWAPDCVSIANGGVVTWTQADAIPHGARIAGSSGAGPCLDLGSMVAGQSNAVTFFFDAELEALMILPLIRPGAVPPALEDIPAECASNAVSVEGDLVSVAYDCRIHGAAMPGKIRIAL